MEQTAIKNKDLLIAQLSQVVIYSPSPFMLWLAPVIKEVNDDGLVFDFFILISLNDTRIYG
jgi:hypothetical protein